MSPKKTVQECDIESHFKKQCKKLRIFTLKNTGMRGIPDRLCVANGRTIWIELKKPGEKPRPSQIARIKELRSYGAEVYVADNNEDVDRILYNLINENK